MQRLAYNKTLTAYKYINIQTHSHTDILSQTQINYYYNDTWSKCFVSTDSIPGAMSGMEDEQQKRALDYRRGSVN